MSRVQGISRVPPYRGANPIDERVTRSVPEVQNQCLRSTQTAGGPRIPIDTVELAVGSTARCTRGRCHRFALRANYRADWRRSGC